MSGEAPFWSLPKSIYPSQVCVWGGARMHARAHVFISLCPSFSLPSGGPHFSVWSPPWIGAELSETCVLGSLNFGEAELYQVRSHG